MSHQPAQLRVIIWGMQGLAHLAMRLGVGQKQGDRMGKQLFTWLVPYTAALFVLNARHTTGVLVAWGCGAP